jgi:large-conductance mechanosensitive channel
MARVIAARVQADVASGLLSGRAHYLHWGVIQISLTNFLIIVAMVLVFVLALVLRFPKPRTDDQDEETSNVHR